MSKRYGSSTFHLGFLPTSPWLIGGLVSSSGYPKIQWSTSSLAQLCIPERRYPCIRFFAGYDNSICMEFTIPRKVCDLPNSDTVASPIDP